MICFYEKVAGGIIFDPKDKNFVREKGVANGFWQTYRGQGVDLVDLGNMRTKLTGSAAQLTNLETQLKQ